MAAGIIQGTVTTTTGEVIELSWLVDDTVTPTKWYNASHLVGANGVGVTVKAASTPPVATDIALVVTDRDRTPVSQTTAAASLPVVQASDWVPLGGYTIFRSLDLDETEEEIKATAGQLYKLRIANNATTVRYVKLYNATAANVTVGTTTPVDTIVIPPASAAGTPTVLTEAYGPAGLAFATAITAAATTGLADNDTGAPGANDIVITAFYK